MSKTIKTTWGKIFEHSNMVLFNEYPNILQRLGEYDELAQFDNYDEESDSYDEIYQWYILDDDAEWLERFCPEIAEDVHWSDTMGHYILAVKHFGTGWDAVACELEIKDEDVGMFYDSYKKKYHDDLPDWVKELVLCEKKQ
jgi:hypothetical protein